jgi:hypothetical protein
MKNAFLTIALTTAMLAGSLVFTNSAEARPRAWGYYGGPVRYYGGYYSTYYPRYYSGYYVPQYYYAPGYYSYPYRYSYGYAPGVYSGGPRAGIYYRF